MTSMKIVEFSRPPTLLVHLRPTFFHPLDLEGPISKDLQFQFQFPFRSAFVFSAFDFFSCSWSLTICFSCGFIFLCVKLSKNITKCLLFIIIHIFSTHFEINLFYLHNFNIENVNKLWSNNSTVHVNKRNQNKNKTKLRHIQIDLAFYCSI